MRRRNSFSIYIALIIFAGVAYGISWDDGSGVNHYWSTPTNWDLDRAPNAADQVYIGTGLSADRQPVIQTGGDVNCANLWIGYRGVGTIEMTGGKIDCNDKLEIAIGYESPPGNVVFGSGYVHLDGGTIETNSIAMRTAYLQSTPEPVEDANALGWMDITGGTLIIDQWDGWPEQEKIEHYFQQGWLTAYGTGSMEEGNIATPERAMLVIDEDWRNPDKVTVTAYLNVMCISARTGMT